MAPYGINRREALKTLTTAGVSAATLPLWVTTLNEVAQAHSHEGYVQSTASGSVFTQAQHNSVALLSELIIPETDTAGAGRALVVNYIDTILMDAPIPARNRFLGGLKWVDERCEDLFGSTFVAASPNSRSHFSRSSVHPRTTPPPIALGSNSFKR